MSIFCTFVTVLMHMLKQGCQTFAGHMQLTLILGADNNVHNTEWCVISNQIGRKISSSIFDGKLIWKHTESKRAVQEVWCGFFFVLVGWFLFVFYVPSGERAHFVFASLCRISLPAL